MATEFRKRKNSQFGNALNKDVKKGKEKGKKGEREKN